METEVLQESKLDKYSRLVEEGRRFDSHYSNGRMLNKDWFNAKNLIYSYTENLNLKDYNVTKLPTGILKNAGFNPKNESEIMAFQLSTPYLKLNIDRSIRLLKRNNVMQELQRILIQFQQLNFTYNDYDLGEFYDDIIIRIQHQTGLVNNFKKIKEETLRIAKQRFKKTIKGMNITSVKDAVHKLELGELRTHFVYDEGGSSLLLKAINKQNKDNNDTKINDCINSMIDAEMYIDTNTINDQLFETGLRQIKSALAERKQEIKDYNVSTFGVKSFKVWKRKFELGIPSEMQSEMFDFIVFDK